MKKKMTTKSGGERETTARSVLRRTLKLRCTKFAAFLHILFSFFLCYMCTRHQDEKNNGKENGSTDNSLHRREYTKTVQVGAVICEHDARTSQCLKDGAGSIAVAPSHILLSVMRAKS